MTISTNLQLAILAMDSYNRGYGAGVLNEGEGDLDGLELAGSQIAGAVVLGIDLPADAQTAGFYAAAYSVTSGDLAGKTVISFRGTDNFSDDGELGGSDIVNGWFGGQGQQTSQLLQSLAFFDSVVESSGESGGDPNKIVVTGHSLGGGLAGFVSMLHEVEGCGFDHMPFGGAVEANHR